MAEEEGHGREDERYEVQHDTTAAAGAQTARQREDVGISDDDTGASGGYDKDEGASEGSARAARARTGATGERRESASAAGTWDDRPEHPGAWSDGPAHSSAPTRPGPISGIKIHFACTVAALVKDRWARNSRSVSTFCRTLQIAEPCGGANNPQGIVGPGMLGIRTGCQ